MINQWNLMFKTKRAARYFNIARYTLMYILVSPSNSSFMPYKNVLHFLSGLLL